MERLSEKLVVYAGLWWSLARARKPTSCALSGEPIERGDAVYRPITNGGDRMKRVRADVMDADAPRTATTTSAATA